MTLDDLTHWFGHRQAIPDNALTTSFGGGVTFELLWRTRVLEGGENERFSPNKLSVYFRWAFPIVQCFFDRYWPRCQRNWINHLLCPSVWIIPPFWPVSRFQRQIPSSVFMSVITTFVSPHSSQCAQTDLNSQISHLTIPIFPECHNFLIC